MKQTTKPIRDKEVLSFIENNINGTILYDKNIVKDFCKEYSDWIQSSKLNNLQGLDKFKNLKYVHGTSESFNGFYLQHNNKRFRILKGDFFYHKIMFRDRFDWEFIENDNLKTNDAVIISLPFSDYCDKHPLMDKILNECDELNIPVFIDCAYMIMSRDINFNFDRKCIEGVSFSMSKGFIGTEHMRIGIRFTREDLDDPIDMSNSFEMVNYIGCDIGRKLIRHYDSDFVQNKYYDKQLEVCQELNIQPTKCVIFGLTDKNDRRFDEYNRGTDWRRICLSEKLGESNV